MTIVIYNHCDPPKKQIPLSIKQRDLSQEELSIRSCIEKRISIPTAGKEQKIVLSLRTDSAHLAKFFAENWLVDGSSAKPSATITALRGSATLYGLAQVFDESRWFCSKTNQVWMFGNEFYGNIKITVRGLCSEIALPEQIFLHGCSMVIDGRGVVLSGVSGAGKTTLTAALRKMLGLRIQIVNDDWGPCSLVDGQLQFTGEPHLHMKYPSVHTLAPHLEISPASHPSENFNGDINDPRARLLIAPHQVFGHSGLQAKTKLRMFVVVTRDPKIPAGVQYLSQQDVTLIEQGKYSRFYGRTEWFLNGSLFIVDKTRQERELNRHRMLLRNFPCIIVNNVVSPEETAELILSELEKLTLQ